ncbi:ligand-binding sensor domain-containing protein [Saccharicrinis sp. 156]|uniref:ligand-binding sensor domain-containing protein n=1 Tax=Saccharicrinis sp. 156 TaxID=3417574 RepID=UPI003D337069
MLRHLTILTLFIGIFHNVSSSKLLFEHLTIEDKLSSNFVKSTFTDRYGYLWIGTFAGVDRFDGLEIKNYNSYFKHEPKSVTSFAEDENNILWIGTENGLYYWNRMAPEFSSLLLNQHKDVEVSKIGVYNNDVLFVGSNLGLFKVNTITQNVESILFHKNQNHLLNQVTGFIIEGDQIYISTKKGLIHYDIELNRTIIYNNITSQEEFSQSYICIAKDNNDIYLGVHPRGVQRFSLTEQKLSEITPFKNLRALSVYSTNDKLMVGTGSKGLQVMDLRTGVVESFDHIEGNPKSLSSNNVYSIMVDDNEVVWLGTYKGGLSYTSFADKEFNTFTPSDSLLFNKSIRSLYFDEHGNKFLGTRNGLYVVSKKDDYQYYKPDEKNLNGKIILKLHRYKNLVLIGTYEGGISAYSYNDEKIKLWNNEVFNSQSIYAFEEDQNGNLWVGGFNGLFRVSLSGDIKTFNNKNSVFTDYLAYAIKVDKENRIWVGGKNGATIYSYENSQFRLIKKLDFGVPIRAVYLYLDRTDKMWIGTAKHGIFQVGKDLELGKRITRKEGLCNNAVTSIIEADNEKFWVSTLNGLTLYNQRTDSCFNYYLQPGIPGVTYSRGAALKTKDGRIWFGNEKGLVYFDYNNIKITDTLGRVNISDIYIGGKALNEELPNIINVPIEEVENLELKGEHNSLGFRFVNLHNKLYESRNFIVKLEGKNDEWKTLVNKNYIYYTELRPGEYTFLVGLENEVGTVIKDSVRSLAIKIKPKWYNSKLTLVFSVLFLLIVVSVLLYYIQSYKKRIKTTVQKSREEENKYQTSSLDVEKSKDLLVEIQNYTEEHKAYLNLDLKILHISEALDVSIHDISQAVNQNLNQGFTDFINNYRIEECKRRLQDPEFEKYTLLAVAETCGFSSKSSFNRAFKKATGITPTEFLSTIETRK